MYDAFLMASGNAKPMFLSWINVPSDYLTATDVHSASPSSNA
jgi:hypothetical protein